MTNSRPAPESRFSRIKQSIIALTRNRKKALLIAAGAAVFITGFLLYLFKTDIKRAQRETIYVHYIGRYNDTSGKYSNPLKRGHDYPDTGSIADERNYAMFHEIALAKYLKNLEDRYNKNFELVIHDNFCDPATSAKIYREIALQMKNNKILVIDSG
ncbi:MAG: hypothetical protein EOP54_24915 [Sphingobacteriales bacterium]|nr:MAG: hypothetical protein EOP54_24915 [Sphingobacteriales bacterium]